MSHIMLDLETMGNSPQAAIIAIGAVRFDHTRVIKEFYETIDLESAVKAGLTMDASTVLWWMQQSDEARAQFTKTKSSLTSVLLDFSDWVSRQGADIQVWGNGADFDNVILANAYRVIEEPLPWKYYNNRCFRTIKAAYRNVPYDKPSIAHHALHDARSQAEHIIKLGILEPVA